MDLIKLLDVSSPKGIKDVLNRLTEHYNTIEEDLTDSVALALLHSERAINASNAATENADRAVQTANTAQQTSADAKQIAEETLAIATQSDATANEAKVIAEGAYTDADEANLTAESALNIAVEARAVIDHALETGALGTIVYDVDAAFLTSIHRSDDMDVVDTATDKYILTPSAIKDAIESTRAFLPRSIIMED